MAANLYPRRPKKLSDDRFHAVFKQLVLRARSYRQGNLESLQARQWSYFNGNVRAVPKRNRSAAVSTEVRDTVEAVHAQLMKIFGGSGRVAEFQATTGAAQQQAEVATEYIHYLFLRANPGWRILSEFLKDALVADYGVFHHCAEPVSRVTIEEYAGLTEAEVEALTGADGVTVLSLEPDDEDEDAIVDPLGAGQPDLGEDEDGVAGLPGPAPSGPPAGPLQVPQAPVSPPAGGPPMPPGPPTMPAQPISGPPGPMGALPGLGQPPPPQNGLGGPPMPDFGPTFRLRLQRKSETTEIRLTSVAPDEFLIDPSAPEPRLAKIMGTDQTRTVGDLTAAGFKWADVIRLANSDKPLTTVRQARTPYMVQQRDVGQVDDPTTLPVQVVQAAINIDADGDGVPELWEVTAAGADLEILEKERIEDWPFTIGSPYVVPHSAIGTGIARLVIDLQDIQTAILRQQLDSLYQAINPKHGVVENQVNMEDVTDEGFGRIIRMRQPGAYAPIQIPFVGEQAFPMIDRLDKIREFRTGVSPQSAGLDADALQSSTEVGVRAVIGQAQLRIETIARNFAENALTDLFRALLKLACRYQDKPVSFKVAQGFLTVDPSGLDPDMNCVPVVGIGSANEIMRQNQLLLVKQTQEMLGQTLGPGNPLVGLQQYRNTLTDLLQLGPSKDVSRYFKPLAPDVDQQMAQQAAAAQQAQHGPGDHADAQATMAKTQAQIQAQQAKTQADIQMQQQKLAAEQQMAQAKMQMEATIQQQRLQMEKMQMLMQAEIDRMKAVNDMQLGVQQVQAETQLEAMKIKVGAPNDAEVAKPKVN